MTSSTETKSPFFALRSHWFYNLAIVLTALLAFIFIPLFILTPEQTKQYLNNGRELQVLGDVLFLSGCASLILAAVYWFFTLIKFKDIGALIVMFALSWVVFAGFLFPLTTASGLFDLRHEPTYVRNQIIVLVLSSVFAITFITRYAKAAQIFMAMFLIISILPTLPRAFSLFEKQNSQSAVIPLSTVNNLLVVGLDGLPGHMVKNVLTSSPDFAQTFKDFTFYENVASTSPATDGSLMGVVYGNHDFTKYENPTWLNIDDLFFNQSDQLNFITSSKYNTYNSDGQKLYAGQFGKAEQRNELFELYHNVVLRLGGNLAAQTMFWVDVWYFPDRQGKFYGTVDGFDQIKDMLQIGSDKPAVFYTHFTFTHWPAVIDENCDNRKADETWYEAHQNEKGIHTGTICGFKKYTDLIDKLKSLGIYDNTTIVFFSDHGKPVLYYEDWPSNLKINGGEILGYDRYQPFLMIKRAGQSSANMTMESKYVLLDDLAKTTCNMYADSQKCDHAPGMNIFDEAESPPDDFYIHVVKDQSSGWAVTHHKAVKISRKKPLLEAMSESPEINLTER